MLASNAHAGTLTIESTSGTPARQYLRFTAGAGEANRVTVVPGDHGAVRVRDDGAPIAMPLPVGGTIVCIRQTANEIECRDPGNTVAPGPPMELLLGDQADSAAVSQVASTTAGGTGADTISVAGGTVHGDAGADTITGRASVNLHGDGDDDTFHTSYWGARVFGGDGNDTYTVQRLDEAPPLTLRNANFEGGPGADTMIDGYEFGSSKFVVGGPGPDTFVPGPEGVSNEFLSWRYDEDGRTEGVRVTPDGVADDGAPGEGDNVPPVNISIEGTDFADEISESPAGGSITALGGNDILRGRYPVFTWFGGNDGDDRIFVRDGARDSVFCAAGNDRVQADLVDILSSDCESVSTR